MSELSISNVARSANWILTQYRNQSAPATYISLGPRQPGTQPTMRHQVRDGI
ncbi:MAG: hypothetical protein ABI759_13530 [Candidatus Solibacter sp.]